MRAGYCCHLERSPSYPDLSSRFEGTLVFAVFELGICHQRGGCAGISYEVLSAYQRRSLFQLMYHNTIIMKIYEIENVIFISR